MRGADRCSMLGAGIKSGVLDAACDHYFIRTSPTLPGSAQRARLSWQARTDNDVSEIVVKVIQMFLRLS